MISTRAKVSLYLTLGIAAVDMLACAFISAVVLFVMFLIPETGAAGGGRGSEKQIMLQWEFTTRKAVIRIDVRRDNDAIAHIFSDVAQLPAGACAALSSLAGDTGCRVVVSDDMVGGLLVVQSPRAGSWDFDVVYADALDSSNGNSLADVSLSMMVIGKSTVIVGIPFLDKDGGLVSLRKVALGASDQNSEDAIEEALTVADDDQ